MPNKRKNELLRFAVVPLSAIVLAFVVASATSLFVVRNYVVHSQMEALANQAADSARFQVNARESELLAQIRDAATSSTLTSLAAAGDALAISNEESRLQEILPYAIRVRLFPVGTARVDHNENPPFTYTSLDMVNRVETGQAVFPEAINNGGRWVLGIAAPVKAAKDDTVHGTLFVYLDMRALSGGLADEGKGEIRVVQSYNNLPANNIVKLGSKGANAPVVSRSLDNPVWKVEFSPSASMMNASTAPTTYFLIPEIAFVVIALLGVLLGISRLIRRVNADAAHLANQMAGVFAEEYKSSDEYTIHAFVDLDANLARLGRRHEEKPEVAPLNVTLKPKEVPQKERVDIEVIDEDEFEKQVAKQTGKPPVAEEQPAEEQPPAKTATNVSEIFRAYDIRGVVNDTLTRDVIKKIGMAIGTDASELGEQTLIVGADGRVSSPAVAKTLIDGLNEAGMDVIDIGTVPTPVLYYATQNSETRSGVMVTASHNPAEYNGFKIVLDGRTLIDSDIQRLWQRFQSGEFSKGNGDVTQIDIRADYMDAILDDVVVARPLKIVVDCGNGVAGDVAPDLLAGLGCDVLPLYCEVDGSFPHHPPDPLVPANLQDLIQVVKSEQADIGVALDGDGDRLVAITSEGEIVWPDRLLMLFAKDVVSRNPGSDVVYDVKCTRQLNSVISSFGGRPVISRSGHSFVKAKMAETNAILGGEMSGHICFGERWFGFDDGIYAAARLLEIVGSQTQGLSALLREFPSSVSTPEIHIAVPDSDKFRLVDELVKMADFADGTVTTIDGLRVDFANGWGLVRPSNTQPCLTLRFEADDQAGLRSIQEKFRELLHAVDDKLEF